MRNALLKLSLLVLGVFMVSFVFAPVTNAKVDIFQGCKDGVDCRVVKSDKTANTEVWKVVSLALTILGGLAVIMIIFGGIMFASSAGDQNKVSSAKNIILYSVIGLVVALSATAIVSLVNDYFGK